MSAVSPAPLVLRAGRVAPPGPAWRLAWRQVADSRPRTLAFGALFAGVAYLQPVAYRHTYPTIADRKQFAHSFADDKAIRLFYGVPHDLLTVGGYTAWRVGAVLAVIAGVWALLAAAGALRGEEDALRSETVLALPVSRNSLLGAALAAIAVQATALIAVLLVGLIAAGLPAASSAFLAVTVGSAAVVFAGVGAVASQLVASRRRAVELSAGALALAFALRVVADTVSGAGWLRWLSPLGWVEQMRGFAHPAPIVLVLPIAAGGLLIAAAMRIARARDLGTGTLSFTGSRPSRLTGLGSPGAFALRSELPALGAWAAGIGSFALIIGMISKSVSAAGISPALRRELARVGSGSVTTPAGYLGFVFLIFILVLSLFACSQIGAARGEEVEGRLETLLAAALGRARWLTARLMVAVTAAAFLSLVAGTLAWVGARLAGVDVSLAQLLLAATNCFAAAALFIGVGALAPRAGVAIVYALVTVLFLWQLFGSLLGAPRWLIDVSPFVHLGFAPARPFRIGPVVVMLALGALTATAAAVRLARRDIVTGS
jgi:ABC-2 type transport system permease protein